MTCVAACAPAHAHSLDGTLVISLHVHHQFCLNVSFKYTRIVHMCEGTYHNVAVFI